jgi:PAS domain S-box-containing protein
MAEDNNDKPLNVLILDDDPRGAFMLRQLLHSTPGCSADIYVHQSIDGLLPSLASRFDICFLSHNYGTTSFVNVARSLKQENPAMQVACITSEAQRLGDRQETLQALQSGITDFLVREELSVKHLALMLKPRHGSSAQITFAQPGPAPIIVPTPGGDADHSRERCWHFDPSMRSARFTPYAEQQLGYEENELGQGIADWKSLIHPDDIDELMREINNCLVGKPTSPSLQYRIKTRQHTWQMVDSLRLECSLNQQGNELVSGYFVFSNRRAEIPPLEEAAELAETATTGPTPSPSTEIREHTDYFQGLFNSASTGMTVYQVAKDGSYVIKWMNTAAETIGGHSDGELIGKRAADYFPRFDDFDLDKALQRVGETGITESHKLMALTKGMAPHWRKYNFSRLDSGDILAEFEDISDEMNIAASQRNRDEIWQHIVRSLPEICLMLDDKGAIIQLVSGDLTPLHPEPETMVGQSIKQLLGETAGSLCMQALSRTLNTGKTQSEIYQVENDGATVWLSCKTAQLRTTPGTPQRVILSARDITEQKRANEILTENRDHLLGIINNLPAILHLKDPDGRYVMVNPQFEDIYNIREEMLLGKTDFEIFPDDLATEIYEADKHVMETGEMHEQEHTIGRDEKRANFLSVNFPVRDGNGVVTGTCGISINVNKLKLISHLGKDALMQHITNGMDKDFSNILAAIMGYSELAIMNITEGHEPEIANHLQQIIEASQRAHRLIDQTVARDPVQEKFESLELTPLVNEVTDLLQLTLPESVTLEKNIEQLGGEVRCDPIALQQALVYLLSHSRDALDGAGTLSIQLRATDQQQSTCSSCKKQFVGPFTELLIQHNGSGDANTERQQLLDQVTSKNIDSEKYSGDFAMVSATLHALGGHFQISDNQPAGNRFQLLLPRAQQRSGESRQASVTKLMPSSHKKK